MPLPANIMSSVTSFGSRPRLAECILQPIDLAPHERTSGPPWGNGANSAIRFQYWPETLTDSKGSEWNPKPVPGGSHPIYQWSSGGERTFAFVAVFTTDTAPDSTAMGVVASVADFPGEAIRSPYLVQDRQPLNGLELGVRDVDIRSAVSWLRWFTYPTYGENAQQRAYEPAKALLVMPNTALGHTGIDWVTVIMTGCDVTYEAWFASGFPRIVEVTLEFKETVQEGESVRFHDRNDFGFARIIGSFLQANQPVVR